MGAGSLRLRMLKAGFGFHSCPRSRRIMMSLLRKGMRLGGLLGGRGRTVLTPSRETVLGGAGKQVAMRAIATSGTSR